MTLLIENSTAVFRRARSGSASGTWSGPEDHRGKLTRFAAAQTSQCNYRRQSPARKANRVAAPAVLARPVIPATNARNSFGKQRNNV